MSEFNKPPFIQTPFGQSPTGSGHKPPANARIQILKNDRSFKEGQIIQAKVSKNLKNGEYELTLANGQKITAHITPPPKIDSRITFVTLKNGVTQLTEMVLDNNALSTKNSMEAPAPNKGQTPVQNSATNIKNSLTTNLTNTSKTDPFESLRPLIGQKISVRVLEGEPILRVENVTAVVTSKPENGAQTLQPQPSPHILKPLPPLRAFFPIDVPVGSTLKLNITNSVAEITNITPAAVTQTTTQKALPIATQNAIVVSSQPVQLSQPLPEGATLTAQIIGKAQSLSPIHTKQSNLIGENTVITTPQFKHNLVTPGGLKLQLTSAIAIPSHTNITLKVTSPYTAEVQQVGQPQTPSSAQTQTPMPKQTHTLQPHIPYSATVTAQNKSRMFLTLENGQQIDLPVGKPLAVGTTLNITLTENDGIILENILQPTVQAKATALTTLQGQWKNLLEALNQLSQHHQQSAQTLKENIPHIGKGAFLPQLLSFIDQMNHQNLKKFTGDEALNLLKALGVDFTADLHNLHAASQKSTDQPESWRALLFPYLEDDQQQPQQGGFFWHNRENEKGNITHTQFIVHLSLQTTGTTQLEGLMHNKELQLKLRSHKPLTPNQQQDLQKIVKQTLKTLSLTGDIYFSPLPTTEKMPISKALQNAQQEEDPHKITV